jgi:hypothetical protein
MEWMVLEDRLRAGSQSHDSGREDPQGDHLVSTQSQLEKRSS